LHIDSDDLSFDFLPNVQAELGVTVPRKEWFKVSTVREISELLETYYRKRMPR